MATVAEIEAAAKRAEAAGDTAAAGVLRAKIAEIQPAPDKIKAAAERAKAAGDQAAYDVLMSNLPTETKPQKLADMPVASAPGAGQAQTEDQMRDSRFAQFEEANPILKGRYTAESFPRVGESVVGQGGGGKSGAARYTVQPYAGSDKTDTFGDTAAEMVEGPMAGARAFAGGLTGGPSPSRDYLASDPLTKSLPGPVLTALGGIGDIGGAALSTVGAGIAGAAGLLAETMPGQGVTGERKLAEDLTGMSMFAVPELAGASSVPAKIAATAPKAVPVVTKAAPKVAEAAIKTPEELGALTKKAASGGMGSVKAQEALAAEARVNPEAKAAAERLGIDLPADVFSDNEMVRATVGLTRSEVGKEPEALWRNAIKGARDKADEIMAAMDGSPDIASVSEAVKSSLQSAQTGLKSAAKSLYEAVDGAVPKASEAKVANIVKALNGVIEDLGGVKGMSAQEKALFDLVTNPDQIVTYGRLMREKNLIGKALERGDSPYSSMDQATLKRLYGALAEDQLATVASIGDDALRLKLKEANQLTAKQKALEKRIINAYGSDLDGSIGAKLKAAVKSASGGDLAGLVRILKVVPEDLRKTATASAISAATRSARATEPGFGLTEFSKVFGGIMTNKPVAKVVENAIGPEAMGMLRDLQTVAKRISVADSNVLRTGKANQALVGALTADGIVAKVLNSTAGQRATQAAAIGVGSMAGGPMVGMVAGPMASAMLKGSPDILAKTGKLFSSPEFQKLAIEAARGGTTRASIQSLQRSTAFRAWASALKIDGQEFLKAMTPQASAQTANMPMAVGQN